MLSSSPSQLQAATQTSLWMASHHRKPDPGRTQVPCTPGNASLSLNLLGLAFELTAYEKVQDLAVGLDDALTLLCKDIWVWISNRKKKKRVNFHTWVTNWILLKHHKHVVMFRPDAVWRFALNRNNPVNVLRMKSKKKKQQKNSLASQWPTLNTPLPLTPAHIQTQLCFCCN